MMYEFEHIRGRSAEWAQRFIPLDQGAGSHVTGDEPGTICEDDTGASFVDMFDGKIQEAGRRDDSEDGTGASLLAVVVPMQIGPMMRSRLDAIYRRYRTKARSTASIYYPFDAASVEDVVQDVFVSLCEAIDRVDISKPMAGWIGRVTSNRCQDQRRRQVVTEELLEANALKRATSEFEKRIEERDDLSHVLQAIEQLPAHQAHAFRKYYIQGVDQKTIAEQLGVTSGYVSKLLKIARITLRQGLDEDSSRLPNEAIGSSRGSIR